LLLCRAAGDAIEQRLRLNQAPFGTRPGHGIALLIFYAAGDAIEQRLRVHEYHHTLDRLDALAAPC
jgi:hypothetical protein